MTDLADKIERLSAAATGGTWMAPRRSSITGRGIVASPEGRMIGNIVDHEDAPENAELIVALRNAVPEILTALRAAQHAGAMAGVVEWYADTFCEHGKYSEVCGRLDDGQCSGCKARAALADYRSVKL